MFVFSKFPEQSPWARWGVTSRQSRDGSCSFPGEAVLAQVFAGLGVLFHCSGHTGNFVCVLQLRETKAEGASGGEDWVFISAAVLLQRVPL